MRLFDDVIAGVNALLPGPPTKAAPYDPARCATDGEKDRILFRSETAFELGGGGKPSVCTVLFGDEPAESRVELYGPDLDAIRADQPFAHVTFARLRVSDGSAAHYEQIQKLGFTVFQVYPEGFLIRVSPMSGREQARVAKAAVECRPPLSLLNVGCSLIREFRKHPEIAAVRTAYITDPAFDYTALADLAAKARSITSALDRALGGGELDCAACKMKPVCDSVEGLRELHFGKEKTS